MATQILQQSQELVLLTKKRTLSPLQREHRRRLRMRMCAADIERILQQYHEAEERMMQVINGVDND